MNLIHKQSGMTLFIALIFLLIMTLFAVSSINMSTVNMRVIGNMQASKYMDAAAQDAIEQMLSTTAIYNVSPVASTITTTLAGIPFVVTINVPTCIDSKNCYRLQRRRYKHHSTRQYLGTRNNRNRSRYRRIIYDASRCWYAYVSWELPRAPLILGDMS